MLPIRRSRNSIPSSPTPGDEVCNLTLAEVRDRLSRNARVLSSFMFSPSTSPATASVLNAQMQAQAGPSRHPQPQATPPRDPVREKLEATREALLAREAELLAQSMGSVSVSVKEEPGAESPMAMEGVVGTGMGAGPGSTSRNGSPVDVKGGYMSDRRGSGGLGATGRSGKQRALDTIRQGEMDLGPNAILLPIEQTLSLGNRDYTTQTLDTFTHLSINKSRTKPKNGLAADPLDENARAQTLARMNTFMSYKGDGDDEDYIEGDEYGDGDHGDVFGFEDGEYEGDDDRMTVTRGARGTGEKVDKYGEDEEEWREGVQDEYTLAGGDLDGP